MNLHFKNLSKTDTNVFHIRNVPVFCFCFCSNTVWNTLRCHFLQSTTKILNCWGDTDYDSDFILWSKCHSLIWNRKSSLFWLINVIRVSPSLSETGNQLIFEHGDKEWKGILFWGEVLFFFCVRKKDDLGIIIKQYIHQRHGHQYLGQCFQSTGSHLTLQSAKRKKYVDCSKSSIRQNLLCYIFFSFCLDI